MRLLGALKPVDWVLLGTCVSVLWAMLLVHSPPTTTAATTSAERMAAMAKHQRMLDTAVRELANQASTMLRTLEVLDAQRRSLRHGGSDAEEVSLAASLEGSVKTTLVALARQVQQRTEAVRGDVEQERARLLASVGG